MEELGPIQQLPSKVRDKILSYLNLSDLKAVRLVSMFFRQWSTPRFRHLAIIHLTPMTSPCDLSDYVATYSPTYLHRNFLIDTTFLQAFSLKSHVDLTMSMDHITELFQEFGPHVRKLTFNHRDSIQLPGQDNFLKKEQVLQFLYEILLSCPNLQELNLDVDTLHPDWFPEGRVFLEVTSLRLDTLQSSIIDLEEGEEKVRELAERIVETFPSLVTFSTRQLWSPVQAKILANMSPRFYNQEFGGAWWPNLRGIKIIEAIRFQSEFLFAKKLMGVGLARGGGISSRPLTLLHLGTVNAQQLSTAVKILNSFRLSLVEVEMRVEIKDNLLPTSLQSMPNLERLSFVDCVVDVATTGVKATSSKAEPGGKKMKIANPSYYKTIRILTKKNLDFCSLSTIFCSNTTLQKMMPKLHHLELTFASGFRTQFYRFFFPGLTNYQNIQDRQICPQIRTLILNYPCLQLDDKYLGWTQAVSKLFPNVHNEHLSYARSCPEVDSDPNVQDSDSD